MGRAEWLLSSNAPMHCKRRFVLGQLCARGSSSSGRVWLAAVFGAGNSLGSPTANRQPSRRVGAHLACQICFRRWGPNFALKWETRRRPKQHLACKQAKYRARLDFACCLQIQSLYRSGVDGLPAVGQLASQARANFWPRSWRPSWARDKLGERQRMASRLSVSQSLGAAFHLARQPLCERRLNGGASAVVRPHACA